MNGLDLFSGIGGLSLALSQWVRPLAYCESDRYAQAILLSRMHEGRITSAPIWDDVTTLVSSLLPRREIDIIYGGFPCQDISVAGHGKGLEGKRSGLFFEVVRLTQDLSPSFVFLENVPAIRTRGMDQVLRQFTDLRYDCRWTCVSAAEVGAPHLRKRWFMLAHSQSDRDQRVSGKFPTAPIKPKGQDARDEFDRSSENVVDSARWATEPDVGRVVNGLPYRSHRIKSLGNAVVPLQAKIAFERLMGLGSTTAEKDVFNRREKVEPCLT